MNPNEIKEVEIPLTVFEVVFDDGNTGHAVLEVHVVRAKDKRAAELIAMDKAGVSPTEAANMKALVRPFCR